jgi:rhamnosyltransferase
MNDILAVVILYNPDSGLRKRVDSYSDAVSKVILIDNSEPPVEWLSAWNDKIQIIKNHSNLGIGAPLNLAAKIAVDENYEWLLTMDQDSRFQSGSFDELKDVALKAGKNVALVAPFHLTPNATPQRFSEPTKTIKLTMTSGNLLRLSAWKTTGPFDEKLFIDSVDHEYYLRLRKNGFTLLRANNSILLHPLGEIRYRKFLFIKLKTTNHSALRRYYITRNRLYVGFKYFFSDFWFFFREMKELVKSFFVVLLMDDDKLKKIRMMLLGVFDFLRRKLDRYQQKS